MSTRGCVAIPWLNGWRGIYNHSDSYATGLGVELWQYLQKQIKNGTLDKFPGDLLTFGRWERLVDRKNLKDETYPTEAPITHKDSDALFIEWVYVVDIKKKQIEIYNHFDTGKKYWEKRVDGTKFESSKYDWVRTKVLSLGKPEPDWKELEKTCCKIAEGFYAD